MSNILALFMLLCVVHRRAETQLDRPGGASGPSLRGSRVEAIAMTVNVSNSTIDDNTVDARDSLNSDEKPVVEQQRDDFENANRYAYHKPTPQDIQKAKAGFWREYLDEWHANQHTNMQGGSERRKYLKGNVSATQGRVKYLYTLGAPGSASPGLSSVLASSFPGVRVISKEKSFFGGFRHDPITWIASANYFWHPRMDAASVDKANAKYDRLHPSSSSIQEFPPTELLGDPSLHSTDETYNPGVLKSHLSQLAPFQKASAALVNISYEQNDLTRVQHMASQVGYNVVGAAKFEGSWVEGVQVSYLLQDPHSLECVLTFQGTYSMEDALWDAAAFPVAFCGLTQRGENCCSDWPICKATCQPERPQDSFVHMGFRNQLRRIVGTKAFQDHIHANLPSCASVTTFGHSLGAAMAELYTACAERDLAAGDFGFQDFSKIGWEKNTPQIIPGPKNSSMPSSQKSPSPLFTV